MSLPASPTYRQSSSRPIRKVSLAALSGLSIGPAIVTIVLAIITALVGHPLDPNLSAAISTVIEGLVILATAYIVAPAAGDAPVPVAPGS